jgi:hypothetical protein
MHKLLPVLVCLATASTLCQRSIATELPFAAGVSGSAVVLVGGKGGGTGGGMGGATGGGMGGATGGGMGGATGGGMGGMTGGGMGGTNRGGMGGGTGGMFGGMADPYGSSDASGAAAAPVQYYLCVTPYDRCSLPSSPGSLRSGASCACSTGHRGTIK